MDGSGIIEQVIEFEAANQKSASHIAVYHGKQLRYLIATGDEGKSKLSGNIAAYSLRLASLMKLIEHLPSGALKLCGFSRGIFRPVNVKLNSSVQKSMEQIPHCAWNLIVGTYDKKQKLIFQCFNNDDRPDTFFKLGNSATAAELHIEIDFLREKRICRDFSVPDILCSGCCAEGGQFNFLATREISGRRVKAELTKSVVKLCRDIAGETKVIDGVEYEFSHGDFAPWNMRINENGYVIFDWENSGMRIKGYDLAYYAVIIETALHKKSFDSAFELAMRKIRALEPDFTIDRGLFFEEFKKNVKTLNY